MLSILIVNWNTRELLRACLSSIERFAPSEPYEVVVVDNASTDQSAEVSAEFPWVQLVASDRNTGYAGGNNLAFSRAKGDLLLTLNPDTEFFDDSLQKAVDLMRENPTWGCLGARLVGVDGKTQRSVRGFPTVMNIFGDVSGLARLFPASIFGGYRLPRFDYETVGPAPQPMGTFLLLRREALAAIGDPAHPFDEAFPIFFNEVDLLYRLDKAGWPCWYSPDVQVRHHGGESTKQVRKSMIWESHRSLVRYLRKHYGRGWNVLWLPVVSGIIYAGAFIRARGYHAGFRP